MFILFVNDEGKTLYTRLDKLSLYTQHFVILFSYRSIGRRAYFNGPYLFPRVTITPFSVEN